MDPNETLKIIRTSIQNIRENLRNEDEQDFADIGEIVVHFTTLDQWLSMGGFLPSAWETERDAQERKNGQ